MCLYDVASPDGSHTPAVVSVTFSKKAGIVDDDKTAQSVICVTLLF